MMSIPYYHLRHCVKGLSFYNPLNVRKNHSVKWSSKDFCIYDKENPRPYMITYGNLKSEPLPGTIIISSDNITETFTCDENGAMTIKYETEKDTIQVDAMIKSLYLYHDLKNADGEKNKNKNMVLFLCKKTHCLCKKKD